MRVGKRCLLPVVVLSFACLAAVAIAADGPALPRLVDLGSEGCVPCKKMAPILEELRTEFAEEFVVEFIDVWATPDAGDKYGIRVIPTQIFLDASGKEQFRHEGFFSREDILAKWTELGVDVGAGAAAFSRWEPAQPDSRPRDAICYLCDGDVIAQTRVVVGTDKGDVMLCSPHCYFIMYSSLTSDREGLEARTTVTDWASGVDVPMASAVYLYGLDETNGRPRVKAFATREAALAARSGEGGSAIDFAALQRKELAARCGFCDRAVYPEDAALVKAGGVHTWGCCSHCAMGVAARTGADIEVHERDRLTGEPIVVRTLQGSVDAIEPPTAVAWYGQRTRPDGTHASAGCFHQGFFTSPDNLRKWVEAHPFETGEMITISRALADKMALTPQQIQKACKIGECAPK